MSTVNYFNPNRWSDSEPGYSAGVRYKGENIFISHRGMAEMEFGHKIDEETRFHVASVSKQFPAYLIMLLAREGKLDLDAPVSEYAKNFPKFDEVITIRHLIHHVSGLRDHWELFRMAGWTDADQKSMGQALRILYKQERLNFSPETEYNYCNTGYTILAYLIELLTEKSMNAYAEEKIFTPLGMTHSFFRENNRLLVPKRTYSYELTEEGSFQKAMLNFSIYGATSLFTTVSDLLLWGEHILSLRKTDPDLYRLMTTDFLLKDGTPAKYAGGLIPDEFLGYELIKHGGWDAGYRTSLIMVPELDAVSCCLSNNSTFKPEGYAKYFLKEALPELRGKEDPFLQKLDELRKEQAALSEKDVCGIYSPLIGSYFLVRKKGKGLFIKMPNMVELPLSPNPDGGYWIEGTEMNFFFWQDDRQKWTLISAYPYDVQYSPKVEMAELPPTELEAYCGSYYSPELEIIHTVSIKDGSLHISQMRLDDSKLYKVQGEAHTFVTESYRDSIEGQIDFILEDDSVVAYELSRPRAKYVKFEKCR